MGNTLGGKKTAKIMKIDGETLKLRTPVQAGEVLKSYPGLVLLDSRAVQQHGARADPLDPHHNLEPKRLYFLVDLPKNKAPTRVRSGINMSAKDRLESLRLTRRSVSDLSAVRPTSNAAAEESGGTRRVRLRLPKAEVERLMRESRDEAEAVERIMELHKANAHANSPAAVAREKRVSFLASNEGGFVRDSSQH